MIKKELIAVITILLAVVSAIIVPPSIKYLSYINWEVLSLLFCLMIVVAGVSSIGAIQKFSRFLILKARSLKKITFILVMLCFFTSMFITNDVALITFIPLTIVIMSLHGTTKMIYVISLQTIAANIGSMLTPIGNPQNIYLWAYYEIPAFEFFAITSVTVITAFLILAILSFLISDSSIHVEFPEKIHELPVKSMISYGVMFAACIMTVLGFLTYAICFGIVILIVLVTDSKLLRMVDYGLLLTFVGFFIFLGNIGSLEIIREFVKSFIDGNEFISGIILSQMISNVPAAIMLSGFTEKYREILLGTNIGGLGTLIASLASIISFKFYNASPGAKPFRYIGIFTALNAAVLFLLSLAYIVFNK
ncbi:MAG: SLC13 family permease [Saccharofermentanales bacterium]